MTDPGPDLAVAGEAAGWPTSVFHADSEPFVTPSGGRMDEIIRSVRDCPSGALSYAIDGDEQRAQTDWGGTRSPTIAVTQDGLPNDPEFRSVFGAYIEWGSRLAVENSTPGATPPPRMPMPQWGWQTAAGPPGSRISALDHSDEDGDLEPSPLPAEGETVGYARHVKGLFRARDRRSMLFAFDLWDYDDVRANAAQILERLRTGSMPCDGAWPPERIAVLARWIDQGTPA